MIKKTLTGLALALALPGMAFAGDIVVSKPVVPLGPPKAMVHAAYMTLENHGMTTRNLIGVKADGYKMAHLHESREIDGVMTMAAVHQIEIAPHQSVSLAPGGLHIMLMHPSAALAEGGHVPLELLFANGESLPVMAHVVAKLPKAAMHDHSGHGS